MSEAVTVTERAAKRIAEIVAGEAAARALRVSVEGGGCSGFQYKFDLVPGAAADDVVLERAGAKVRDRPGFARISRRLGDRFRRRPDRRIVPGHRTRRRRRPAAAAPASRSEPRSISSPARWPDIQFWTTPSAMKITTWNINGVKARLESAIAYLQQASPDVICLQEIKSVDGGLSRRRVRRARLPLRRARPEGLQRRRHPVEAAAGRVAHGPAGQRRR